jgi:hypothetical protein
MRIGELMSESMTEATSFGFTRLGILPHFLRRRRSSKFRGNALVHIWRMGAPSTKKPAR